MTIQETVKAAMSEDFFMNKKTLAQKTKLSYEQIGHAVQRLKRKKEIIIIKDPYDIKNLRILVILKKNNNYSNIKWMK